MRTFVLVFIVTALVAAAIGFGACRVLDLGVMNKLETDRDAARDCRHSGATLPPCPVEYRNTKYVQITKTETRPTPDPKQAERIATLSADLSDAQRAIRDLEGRMAARRTQRPSFNYYSQNGSMAHPYYSADRCPTGAAVVYAAAPPARGATGWRSGDPNVCYVRIMRRRTT